jgi:RecB family exonuclease
MFRASSFKLGMFDTCAQQYKFTYIDDLAKQYKTPKPYLTMGAHVHNALKDFYEIPAVEERTYATLETLLRKRWVENRQGFSSREDEAKWGAKALNMLRIFAHRMDTSITPTLLEDYYDVEVDPSLKILGRIDRADELEDGTLHVIDYKTGKYKPEEISESQLLLYATIVSANRPKPVTKASFLYLQSWEWHTVEIDAAMMEAAVEQVREQVAMIQQEKDFDPEPNKYCKNCDFLTICPEQKQIELLIDEGKL